MVVPRRGTGGEERATAISHRPKTMRLTAC
jgi:hypothetical protein